MKLIVNPHKIELIKEEAVNEKEINISKCTFEFSEEYGDNLVKEAYFTLDGNTYKQIIVNNECSYPPEVLAKEGTVELGVVAYEVQDEEYIERFNPSPVYFQTIIGSLKDHAENSQEITPSEMEQFEQALEDGLAEVANVDIDASKTGSTATVSITNRYGVTKSVEIYDGEQGEDGEPGITPNIQVGNTTTLPAGSNATVTQRGTTENPIFDFGIPKGADGEGKVTSVNGQIGDVVINIPDTSGLGASIELSINSSTYVMTLNLKNENGTVLSTGTVDLPLESVVVNGSYDNTNKKIILTLQNGNTIDIPVGDLVSGLQTEITSNNKLSSDLVDDTNHTNKFVTASDKTTWNGKQDALVSGTNIKTINNTSLLGSGDITISAAPDVDNSTITLNASNQIQTVGIKDNNNGNTDKIWTGTLQQYNAIQNKDADTFYYITDDDATSTLRQKVEVITSSDTSYTIANLTANKSYKLSELTALTITACETFDEESVIYFDSGSTATSIFIPSDITNLGDAPTMTTTSDINTGTCEASKSYIISILNKIAVWKAY